MHAIVLDPPDGIHNVNSIDSFLIYILIFHIHNQFNPCLIQKQTSFYCFLHKDNMCSIVQFPPLLCPHIGHRGSISKWFDLTPWFTGKRLDTTFHKNRPKVPKFGWEKTLGYYLIDLNGNLWLKPGHARPFWHCRQLWLLVSTSNYPFHHLLPAKGWIDYLGRVESTLC